MIFSKAEIDILRLCTWCKDLPVTGCRNIPADTLDWLLALSLIRLTRQKSSYRITPIGLELLQKAGYRMEADANLPRIEAVLQHSRQDTHILLLEEQVDTVGRKSAWQITDKDSTIGHPEYFTLGEHIAGGRFYRFRYDGRTYRILERAAGEGHEENEEILRLEEADSRKAYDAGNRIKRPERFGGM